VSSSDGVLVLSGQRRGYDEVRRDAASPMTTKVASIACWCEARVRLEHAVAAGVVQQFWRNGRKMAAGFWQRRSRGGRAIYSGERLGVGVRVRVDVGELDGGGRRRIWGRLPSRGCS
jgi:hypothetical protein